MHLQIKTSVTALQARNVAGDAAHCSERAEEAHGPATMTSTNPILQNYKGIVQIMTGLLLQESCDGPSAGLSNQMEAAATAAVSMLYHFVLKISFQQQFVCNNSLGPSKQLRPEHLCHCTAVETQSLSHPDESCMMQHLKVHRLASIKSGDCMVRLSLESGLPYSRLRTVCGF